VAPPGIQKSSSVTLRRCWPRSHGRSRASPCSELQSSRPDASLGSSFLVSAASITAGAASPRSAFAAAPGGQGAVRRPPLLSTREQEPTGRRAMTTATDEPRSCQLTLTWLLLRDAERQRRLEQTKNENGAPKRPLPNRIRMTAARTPRSRATPRSPPQPGRAEGRRYRRLDDFGHIDAGIVRLGAAVQPLSRRTSRTAGRR
jgi:hypothetical protein